MTIKRMLRVVTVLALMFGCTPLLIADEAENKGDYELGKSLPL